MVLREREREGEKEKDWTEGLKADQEGRLKNTDKEEERWCC